MSQRDLSSYAGLAERWVRKLEPFNGDSYWCSARDGAEILVSLGRVVNALSLSGLCNEVVLGLDYFVDGDDFYPKALSELNKVYAFMESAFAQGSRCENSPDCSLCVLATNLEWALRLHTFEPESAEGPVEATADLLIARKTMSLPGFEKVVRVLREDADVWDHYGALREFPGPRA